jgi:hypothetical protein
MRDRVISANHATSSPSRPPDVVLVPSKVNVRSADSILPLKVQNSNAFNVFLPLLGAFGLCSHGPRAACSPARRGRGHTPAVVPITDTYHKRHLPAQYGRRPASGCPQQPPPRACRQAAVCGGGRSPAHERPQRAAALVPTRPSSPPVCVGGRWTSVDVAVRATGCCRGATTDGSAHTRGRQDQPNDKDQWAWVSADTVSTTGCDPWVLAIAKRPSSRQSTDTGCFWPMGSCRSSRASRRLHSSN